MLSGAPLIIASTSSRKYFIIETTGAVDDGPRGQIVVIAGGHVSPGLMLSETSSRRPMSSGRP